MRRYITYSLFVSACLVSHSSFALGTVSRACRFDQLPNGTANISVRFFYAIGAPDSVLDLPGKSATEQQNYWVLESLTTDYLRGRYLLFARRWLYHLAWEDPVYLRRSYDFEDKISSLWTAKEITSALQADPHFAPYYLNRGPLFSARAGHPGILEYRPAHPANYYLVHGTHYYYDLKGGAAYRLSDTFETTCNLTNWGVGLWDR